VIHRISDMVFASYDRPLHPELIGGFRVISLLHGGLSAHVYLGRLSHLLVFSDGEYTYSEILISESEFPGNKGLIKKVQFTDLAEFTFSSCKSCEYRMTAVVEKLAPKHFNERVRASASITAENRIAQVMQTSEIVPKSTSFASAIRLDSNIVVSSEHCFGADSAVLKTFSNFGKKNG
jgi:hypothetical protein